MQISNTSNTSNTNPLILPSHAELTDAELISLWMFEADLEAGFYDCDC